MFTPDSYLYETNLTLLASLSAQELADAELMAQIAPGASVLAELGAWLAAACMRGVAHLGAAFTYAPAGDEADVYWHYPPLY